MPLLIFTNLRLSNPGKSRKDINFVRLTENIIRLQAQIDNVKQSYTPEKVHAGNVIFFAEMYEDRLRPTLTPDDIFNTSRTSSQLVTSTRKGYLVESALESLGILKEAISTAINVNTQVDISSIKSIKSFDPVTLLGEESITRIWDCAFSFNDDLIVYKSFSFWLMPFQSEASRLSVAKVFKKTADDNVNYN